MVAPLSAKLNQKMQLDQSKALADEKRKQELQEIKLQDAEAKANLGILFKTRDQIIKEKQKLADSGMQSPVPPLPAVPQASGGIPEFTPGGDDQVATVKTGEAIIPVEAAQDPKNKAVIAQLVDEGRQAQGYKRGTVSIPKPTKGLTGMTQQENMLPIIPVIGRRKKMQGYRMGTTGDADDKMLESWLQQNEKYQSVTPIPKPYDAAWTAARESGAAGTAAKNPNSSASGLYQMTDAAWVDAIKKNPSLQKMDRADKTTQEIGRSTYRSILADRLTAQGIEPTDKALAQAWFIGPAGLGNVVKGDPNAPLAVSSSARSLNPALQNVTNAEFLAKDDPYSRTLAKIIPTPRNLARDQQMTHGPKQFSGDYQRAPAIPRPGESQTVDSDGFRGSAEAKIMDYNTSGLSKNNSISSMSSRYLNNRDEPATQSEISAQVPPPEPQDSSLEEINKHFSDTTRDNQSALIEIRRQGDGITDVEEKKNFFERMLSNIYGRDDSLVNPATAARFIAGAALGMASGGSTNGSIRWAAQDTLRNYDQLHQQEASDNRMITAQADKDVRAEKQQSYAERKAMLPQLLPNYESEGVYKFLKTGDVKDLGKRRPTSIVNSEFEDFVPRNAPSTAQPVRLYKVPNQDGKGFIWKTKDGQQLPENYVTTKEHSGLQKSISDNHKAFEEKLAKDFDSKLGIFFGSKGGAKDSGNASLQNLPTSSEMASQLSSTLRGMGYPIDAPEMQERAHAIGKIVTDSVIAEHKTNNGKTIDISPHVYRAMLIGNSQGAINSTDFMLSTNKSMDSNKLKDLITTAQNNVYKTEPSVKNPSEVYQKATEKLMALKQEYASKPSNKMQDSDSETGFYRFAKKNLLIK